MFYRVRNHAVFRKNIKLTEGTPVMTKVRNHAFIRNNKDYPKNIHPSGSATNEISNTTSMSALTI